MYVFIPNKVQESLKRDHFQIGSFEIPESRSVYINISKCKLVSIRLFSI